MSFYGLIVEQIFRLYDFTGPMSIAILALQGLFLIFYVYYLIKLVIDMKKRGIGVFFFGKGSFWRLYLLGYMLLLLVLMIFQVSKVTAGYIALHDVDSRYSGNLENMNIAKYCISRLTRYKLTKHYISTLYFYNKRYIHI